MFSIVGFLNAINNTADNKNIKTNTRHIINIFLLFLKYIAVAIKSAIINNIKAIMNSTAPVSDEIFRLIKLKLVNCAKAEYKKNVKL
jgi:hypothetical protein